MKKTILTMASSLMLATTGCKTTAPKSVETNAPTASVVVIGVENSRWAGACPGSTVDANRMYGMFKSEFSDVTILKNERATRYAVDKALRKAAKSDFMIVYYSGHGGSQGFPDTGPEEKDGQDEFLCLYDNYFRDNEIWNIISKCKGRVWLIFDCCHSETMFRSVGFKMQMLNDMVFPLSDERNILVWSGCADDKLSYGEASGGIFTRAFLQHFDSRLTYDQLWDVLSRDPVVKLYETIKITKIGIGFNNKLVFK